jgi:hypothetical protein
MTKPPAVTVLSTNRSSTGPRWRSWWSNSRFPLPSAHERPRPATVYEAALGVLAGTPGGLHHPIQRHVLDDRQLPHRITSSPLSDPQRTSTRRQMVGKAERPADHRQFPLEAAPRRVDWPDRRSDGLLRHVRGIGRVGLRRPNQARPVGWVSQHRQGDGMRSTRPRDPSWIGNRARRRPLAHVQILGRTLSASPVVRRRVSPAKSIMSDSAPPLALLAGIGRVGRDV